VNPYLPFIISGAATGSVFGLAGAGLVLTYKTTGIFNFGYGALATAAAYLFYWLYVDNGMEWWAAAAIVVLGAGVVMGLLMEKLTQRLAHQGTAWKVVGTVGLILLVQGLGTILYGVESIPVPKFLPADRLQVGGAFVGLDQIIVVLVSVACVGGLYAFFRRSRSGVAMRALVDDPGLLDLQGTSPVRIRRLATVVGSVFAALSGVLIVPFMGLESIALTFLVVQAFGAAAIGWFSNIPVTYIGGITLGILAALATKVSIGFEALTGLPQSVPFIVLFIVLLVTPKRRLAPSSLVLVRPRVQYHGPASTRVVAGLVVVGLLALVPLFGGVKLTYWTEGLIQAIIILSLGLLVRTAGLVSLCTTAFAGIGVVSFSHFMTGLGLPWIVAVLLGAAVAIPVGALLAMPAIRLRGVFLALATFGAGIMIERLFYPKEFMFTSLTNGLPAPRPSFAQGDSAYYYVVLAFLVVAALVIVAIHEGRLGRMLRGLGEAPTAVSTLGLSVNVTRVIVFCIAAFLAGIGGVLHGSSVQVAGSTDLVYTSFYSLVLVAILALAPFREPWFAIVGGIAAVIPGYITATDTPYWLNVIFGVSAILIAMEGGPIGMPPALARRIDRLGRRRLQELRAEAGDRELVAAAREARPGHQTQASGLEVSGITVRFGGLTAVAEVSLAAPVGRITGLIGPNGAGKTTTFNTCSGLTRPTSGTVMINGADVTGLPAPARARAGIGRTFQVMELGESLTVFDNVALGREAGLAGAHPLRQVVASRREARLRRAAALDALEMCGIEHLAGVQAGNLSTGERRLVELARCLAGPFDVLLLDEPSSGLDRNETEQFAEVLRRVVRERGCGILLVEHDMNLVMSVCAHIYVLDFGRLIFEGAPDEVMASPVVQAAYLGADADLEVPLDDRVVTGEVAR
jgi:ABC-type branched-subunit amino acid transport system ATPase component/branched-subunit amino acid ABC-type transport system permease component